MTRGTCHEYTDYASVMIRETFKRTSPSVAIDYTTSTRPRITADPVVYENVEYILY